MGFDASKESIETTTMYAYRRVYLARQDAATSRTSHCSQFRLPKYLSTRLEFSVNRSKRSLQQEYFNMQPTTHCTVLCLMSRPVKEEADASVNDARTPLHTGLSEKLVWYKLQYHNRLPPCYVAIRGLDYPLPSCNSTISATGSWDTSPSGDVLFPPLLLARPGRARWRLSSTFRVYSSLWHRAR